jgi:hypothetical protein
MDNNYIDLQHETPITLKEVPKRLPTRHGRKVHYATTYRWVTKGVRGKILPSLLIGGIRYTTVEALDRIVNGPTQARPDSARTDEVLEVNKALDEAGL